MKPHERIIVALDTDSIRSTDLVEKLGPHVGLFKIGLQFIYSMLASLIVPKADSVAAEEDIVSDNLFYIRKLFALLQGKIFWDGKLCDIPNTVGGASAAISRMGVRMFNVHASAGRNAVVKAVEGRGSSLVLGVTVLTSIDSSECVSIFGAEPGPKVVQFAKMLAEVDADGIICSPQELRLINEIPEAERLLKVTPGVRPLWAAAGDQKRVMTPGEAIKAGANYLVIGRPITAPPEHIGGPLEAAEKIAQEIAEAEAK